jgi:hypothetical protein
MELCGLFGWCGVVVAGDVPMFCVNDAQRNAIHARMGRKRNLCA